MLIAETDILALCEPINGIIQVGGHIGQEIPVLLNTFKCGHILIFEPDVNSFNQIPVLNEVTRVNSALGNTIGKIQLNLASNGQSSSILNPKTHLDAHPWVKFSGHKEVEITTLDTWLENNATVPHNFLMIDVQGYELEVLLGANKTLCNVDYIMCEVNCDELYENCARVEEIDLYLLGYGFERVKTVWWENAGWGDALYIKKKCNVE